MTGETERPTIVVASRNPKKAAEIRELLEPRGFPVRSVADFPDAPADVVEDGQTFADNAAKKAVETAQAIGQWTLGEDSGLSVDALGGRPGVYSARYSGEDATDAGNNAKLLAELADVPDGKRGAHYTCHVALADPQGQVRLRVERTCRGRIARKERGTNGFGYDPLFLIPEYHRTFGELSPLLKHCLSHRGRAFEELVRRLERLFDPEPPAARKTSPRRE